MDKASYLQVESKKKITKNLIALNITIQQHIDLNILVQTSLQENINKAHPETQTIPSEKECF